MPECAKAAYQAARKTYAIDKVLHPRLLSEAWYEEKAKNSVSKEDDFFLAICRELDELFTGSTLLLCGFEGDSPEIYILSDPGLLNSASAEGFGVIGIGEDTARNRLYTLDTAPSDSIGKVLYDAYDAKESCAEFLPEVGHEWDAAILTQNGSVATVEVATQSIIEYAYMDHPKSPFMGLVGDRLAPDDWKKQLVAWEDSILKA